MKSAYLDCPSGVAGDMVLAALIDAGVDANAIQAGVDSLRLPSCKLVVSEVSKCGFRALHVDIEHAPEHAHRHLSDITAMIEQSALTASQRELATRIFTRLAEAEAKVHGTTIERVHFHEVGAVDSIADIVGAAIGWDLLGVEHVVCSPIPTGTGFIEIAHGRVSIPAPATAELLSGAPVAESRVIGELTTPTGAAIATTLATEFGPLPSMRIDRIGYGAGTADFEQPNILRLIVGQTTTASSVATDSAPSIESICVLESNVDDTTGEILGYCAGRLWDAGALDVSFTPIQMKKGRPGVAIAVQCAPGDMDAMEQILFNETTTLGVRRSCVERRVLHRETCAVEVEWGSVQGIVATTPNGGKRFAPEYDACLAIAKASDVPYSTVVAAAQRAWEAGLSSEA